MEIIRQFTELMQYSMERISKWIYLLITWEWACMYYKRALDYNFSEIITYTVLEDMQKHITIQTCYLLSLEAACQLSSQIRSLFDMYVLVSGIAVQ